MRNTIHIHRLISRACFYEHSSGDGMGVGINLGNNIQPICKLVMFERQRHRELLSPLPGLCLSHPSTPGLRPGLLSVAPAGALVRRAAPYGTAAEAAPTRASLVSLVPQSRS